MKSLVRDVMSRAAVASGMCALGRSIRQPGSLILYGHRISADDEGYLQGLDPEWFTAQLTYLTRHYDIISLTELVAWLEEGMQPPANTVVLTLDDGFRDNVEVALPILDRFGVHATIFVVTQSLSDGRLPWSQRLGYAFQHAQTDSLEHVLLGPDSVPLTDDGSRHRTCLRVKHALTTMARPERDRVIDDIASRLGATLPTDRMMTWEDARMAVGYGHVIGAHTFSHALLAEVTEAEARVEMERSQDDLREHLGLERPHFCFPGGSTTPALCELARSMGFRSAFLPNRHRRLNRPPDVDAFSMVRTGLPNGPAHHLEAELDGPFHVLRRLARRYDP